MVPTSSLVIDFETSTPTGKPDFRVDVLERAGWLESGAEVAKWSSCLCPLPNTPYLTGHNLMYDLGILWRLRPSPLQRYDIHDTLALAYGQGEEDLSLKGLMQKYLKVNTDTFPYQRIGVEQAHGQDLWGTQRLFPILRERQRGTCYDIDRALIPALIDCSYRGYEIDPERLEKAIEKAEASCSRAETAFSTLVADTSVLLSRRKVTRKRWPEDTIGLYGDDVVVGDGPTRYRESYGSPGINSPIQLQRYFDVPSVDKIFLQLLAAKEGPKALAAFLRQQWVAADKLLDTYFYPNRGKDQLTGLFNITPTEDMEGGAGTGRLSSERSNMQNQAPAMERCLRAPKGFLILRGDYSQIELRGSAEISGDEGMLTALADPNRDLHQEAADRFFGGNRKRGKVFNFRELYICGPEVKVAYPGFYAWAERHWLEVQRTGVSVGPEPFLHRRPIPLLGGDHARRQAINHPPQNLAVYITKAAMVRLFRAGWMLVNQVHDAIHAYIPEDDNVPLRKAQFREIMEETAREYLPRLGASVEVKCSKYWSEEDLL